MSEDRQRQQSGDTNRRCNRGRDRTGANVPGIGGSESPKTSGVNRRDVLKGAAQAGAGLAIAAIAAMSLRGRRNAAGDQTCNNRGLCARCGSADGCGLPQAMSYRAHRRTSTDLGRTNASQ
jgi:hypothetical protein